MNLEHFASKVARAVDVAFPWPRLRELEALAQRLALRVAEQQRFIAAVTARLNEALDDQRRSGARADRLVDAEAYIAELEALLTRATREIRDQRQRDAITADSRAAKRYWLGQQGAPAGE